MFTYKFVGLLKEDAPTPYYYGSLPAKPELGHILVFHQTKNRYAIVGIEGEGLVSTTRDGSKEQSELAWADISARKAVPTLHLQRLLAEIRQSGRSWEFSDVKKASQENRSNRLSRSKKSKK